jgi:ComF family protein
MIPLLPRIGLVSNYLLSGVLNFFYPPVCHVCGGTLDRPTQLVCHRCWSGLPQYGDFRVQIPGSKRHIDTTVVGLLGEGDFDDPVNNIVHQLKYGHRRVHAQGLASRLGGLLAIYPWMKRIDVIIPVPLHRSRIRARGYNQSQLLADELGNLFGVRVVSKVLVRTRSTQSQTRLTARQRQQNVAGAFAVSDAETIRGKRILLVDDVVTTGYTLNECAKTLKRAGARDVQTAAAVHFQHQLP